MSYTYNYTAAACPAIQAPSTFIIGSGSGNYPFVDGQTGYASGLNQMFAALNVTGQIGACGYGIVTGIDVVAVATPGLNVYVTPGIALVGQPLELVSSVGMTPLFYQQAVPSAKLLADNSVNYVWLTQTGKVTSSVSTTPPASAVILLAIVTCASGSITNIDYSNRPGMQGAAVTRQTADIGPPTDAPPAGLPVITLTTTGKYQWNGVAHTNLAFPTNVQTVTTTLNLTPLSSRNQLLTPSGASQIVVLPALATLEAGAAFQITNFAPSGGHNFQVQANSADGSTVLVSYTGSNAMTPGKGIVIPVISQSSGNTYPSGYPYTPAYASTTSPSGPV